MRMQSILVRPYVLECLNRFEREHMKEEFKHKKSPKAKMNQSGFFNKKRHVGMAPGVKQLDDNESDGSFSSEDKDKSSSESDSEEEIAPVNFSRRMTKLRDMRDVDPAALQDTPKVWYNKFNFDMIDYEDGEDRMELPEYTEWKAQKR